MSVVQLSNGLPVDPECNKEEEKWNEKKATFTLVLTPASQFDVLKWYESLKDSFDSKSPQSHCPSIAVPPPRSCSSAYTPPRHQNSLLQAGLLNRCTNSWFKEY